MYSYDEKKQTNKKQPAKRENNNTGLPDQLKSGIENLSGHSMDDVNVHYNSPKPMQMKALAYAQGTNIHIASGQEKHLPHEAWHIVQQKQGRVKATTQMKGGVNVNDEAGLEREADVMGTRASQFIDSTPDNLRMTQSKTIQRMAKNDAQVVQRVELNGSLGVFKEEAGVHTQDDEDFKQIYETVRTEDERETDQLIIAVLDTGIKTKDTFLVERLIGAGDFTRTEEEAKEEPYTEEMVVDPHGSQVAGQAAFGTNKIKIIDARIQPGFSGLAINSDGTPNMEFIANVVRAIQWSVEQGARIITSSLTLPWGADLIQKELDKHPQVFVLTTSGNDRKEFKERQIDGGEDAINDRGGIRKNAFLVGGATTSGEEHKQRGFGAGVDVMVPSASGPTNEDPIILLTPFAFLREKFIKDGMTEEKEAELRAAGRLTNFVWGAAGVSFGIPAVANMIAKMMLIYPDITSEQIYDIIVNEAVQEKGGALNGQSKSNGMIDPKKAYEIAAALAAEQDVTEQGVTEQPPTEQPPVVETENNDGPTTAENLLNSAGEVLGSIKDTVVGIATSIMETIMPENQEDE